MPDTHAPPQLEPWQWSEEHWRKLVKQVRAGQRSRMSVLEELIQHMRSRAGVWFDTHEDIARYVKVQARMG